MSVYTKSFNIVKNNNFSIKKTVSVGPTQIVFAESENGIVVYKHDETAEAISAKEIIADGQELVFCDVVPGKQYIVFAKSRPIGSKSSYQLHLIGIRPDGSIFSQRKVELLSGISDVLSVLPLGITGELFILMSATPRMRPLNLDQKDYYGLKINKELAVLQSTKIEHNGTDQYSGAIFDEPNIVLYGKRVVTGNTNGLLTLLDINLVAKTSIVTQEASNVDGFTSAMNLPKDGIVLFGTSTTGRVGRLTTKQLLSTSVLPGVTKIKVGTSKVYGASCEVTEVIKQNDHYLCVTKTGDKQNRFVAFDKNLKNISHLEFSSLHLAHLNAIESGVLVSGMFSNIAHLTEGIVISMTEKYEACGQEDMALIRETVIDPKFEHVAAKTTAFSIVISPETIFINNTVTVRAKKICEKPGVVSIGPYTERGFKFTNNKLIQSPHLNLQAAGSGNETKTDSTKGIHLRWFLANRLENHVPKGNLAGNTAFLNKPNDFVDLYRVPYIDGKLAFEINFLAAEPTINGNRWNYKIMTPGGEKLVILEFMDQAVYNTSKGGIPTSQLVQKRGDILRLYGQNIFKLSVQNQLVFSVKFNAKTSLEAFSTIKDFNTYLLTDKISLRKIVGINEKVFSENISFMRFTTADLSKTTIQLESYSDIIAGNNHKAAYMGAFALEVDTTKALSRLENANIPVNKVWNKFDEAQKVKTENYKKRWNDSNYGIKSIVQKYLELSNTSQAANETYSESSMPDAEMEISFLSMLKVSSLDFHNARMLGLGNIDPSVENNQRFIYLVEYHTNKNLEDTSFISLKDTQHIYFSLPTGIEDKRLPQNIVLNKVTYGLRIETATSESLNITDEGGYAYKQFTRFINLKTDLQADYSKSVSFFNPQVEFETSKFSAPVFVGFKKKKAEDSDWQKPDLIHSNENYFSDDANTIEENSFAVFNPIDKNVLDYTDTILGDKDHPEVTYKHLYAAYPVNIFSRTSGISNIETVISLFKNENALKPPSGIKTHMVQEESIPPLFSTTEEQNWLGNIEGDKTLVRLLFDYNHVQGKNYNYAKKVRIFHRKTPLRSVIGGLNIALMQQEERYCTVPTTKYVYNEEEYIPKIIESDKHKFIGSFLTFNNKNFEVVEVINTNPSGEYPQLKLKKNEIKSAFPNGDGTYQLNQTFEAPIAVQTEGNTTPENTNAFLLVENLSEAKSWTEPSSIGNQLGFEIDLENNLFQKKDETYYDEENNPNTITVRGIWDNCTVKHEVLDPGVKAQYRITFNDVKLANHPQYVSPDNAAGKSSVNWFRGFVRIHAKEDAATTTKKARKVLAVTEIINIGSSQKLVLIADDPDYKQNQAASIITGMNVSVNFYPSYQVYLRNDQMASFNETSILPLSDENEHTTLIGLQSVDTTHNFTSPVGVPSPLVSHKVIRLNQPEQPKGPLFATPPNYYGKAKYTFTTKFTEKPWGVVFFRADINRILSVLYKQDTLVNYILPAILPINEDEFFINRWQNLLKVECNAQGKFNSYTDQFGNDFAFPAPDNDQFGFNISLIIGSEKWKEHIRRMISNCMLPLTENPIICQYIKGTKPGELDYVPTPKKQTLRSVDGKVLHPSDEEFDMAPMAKKISDKEIQFTDFTLEGNMDVNTAYVYCVKEMNMSLKFGKASEFLGPVQLINTTAPEPVIIKKMSVKTPSFLNSFAPGVIFEVNKINESENISKILIYRFENSLDALTSRETKPVKEFDLSTIDQSESTFIIEDDFSDDSSITYGKPIYYHLVAVRKITYSEGEDLLKEELVYSKPSKTFIANIVDVRRPEKPAIKVSFNKADNNIVDLQFSVNKCCPEGKYNLLYLNADYNWESISSVQTDEDQISIGVNNNPVFVELNEDGKTMYHKFKMVVENTTGIRNESDVFTLTY